MEPCDSTGRRCISAGEVAIIHAFMPWADPLSSNATCKHKCRTRLESWRVEDAVVRGLRRYVSRYAILTWYFAEERWPLSDDEFVVRSGVVY